MSLCVLCVLRDTFVCFELPVQASCGRPQLPRSALSCTIRRSQNVSAHQQLGRALILTCAGCAAGPEAGTATPAGQGPPPTPLGGVGAAGGAVGGWDASSVPGPAGVLLQRFRPLGASDCSLFGRKFAAPETGVDLARAAHFMARPDDAVGVAPLRL